MVGSLKRKQEWGALRGASGESTALQHLDLGRLAS